MENYYNGNTWKFGESIKNRMGIGVPEQNAADTYERGMDIVPDCIKAGENEIPVKQYNIVVLRNLLKFERAEGRLQITNRRVVFRAAGRSAGGRTALQHEFNINEIAGVEARRNCKFSFLYLIFAAIIVSFSYFTVSDTVISGKLPIFPNIMSPHHVVAARDAESVAMMQKYQAQDSANTAASNRKLAEDREKRAVEARLAAEKNEKRAPQGEHYGWYFRDYKKEKLDAQNAEKKAVAARESAEREEKKAIAQKEFAETAERDAIAKRESAEKTWVVLMTVLGLILGFGGLTPFFALYKKFGVKLLILNLAVFGFALSLTASGSRIFYLFLILSIITVLVCMFLFCFRPNLIIRVKNKGLKEAVDISGKTGFAEIIPTGETEGAIREIGAIIVDIQTSGDSGAKRWARNVEPLKPLVSIGAAEKIEPAKPPAPAPAAENAEPAEQPAPAPAAENAEPAETPAPAPAAENAENDKGAAPPSEATPPDNTATVQSPSGITASPHVPPNPAQSSGKSGKKRGLFGIITGIIVVVAAAAAIIFALAPDHKEFYEKGKACLDAENYAEAVNYLSKAIKVKPKVAQYHYWRGFAHLSKEAYGEAVLDFTEAIRLAPESASYRFDRASAYYALRDYDKAIADYTEAIRLDPSDARYYNSRGNAYRLKEDYDKAASDHTEAIKLNPDDARYHNNLGVAYLLNKDYDNAIAAYTEAIRLTPDNARYLNNRGGAYSLKKDFDSAVEDFTEAARLDPGNSEYGKNLDKALSEQGKNR